MPRQSEQNDKYYSTFPVILRELLERHPEDGHTTTYKALGEAVGVRQQTVSQYASGQTQPTADVLLRIAQFFGVSVDYMLTGTSSHNMDITERLGLTEQSIGYLEMVKDVENFEGMPTTIEWVNDILSDGTFYDFLLDLTFRVSVYNARKEQPPEKKRKTAGMDLEGYYLWQIRTAIDDYIKDFVKRHWINDEDESV